MMIKIKMEFDFQEDKSISDPIHGFITLPGICWKFIDSPWFQRLRNVKQLGATYYMFPGASHNRFEHSIGTAYLSQKVVRHLKKEQPELVIDEDIETAITLAGLLHDLGHGPYSHAFDHIAASKIGLKNYTHEKQSTKIIQHIVDSYSIDLDTDTVNLVKNLVLG